MSAPQIDALMKMLARLPGVGPRSARRIVLHLIERKEYALDPLIDQMTQVSAEIESCQICGNLDASSPCGICQDTTRDQSKICVVTSVSDLWALERTGAFRGRYIVLGGVLSALDGVRPEDLRISSLLSLVEQGGVEEVILALGATVDGQTTAHYLADHLHRYPVTLSHIAHGIPIGGELDYLDDGTLVTALRARRDNRAK